MKKVLIVIIFIGLNNYNLLHSAEGSSTNVARPSLSKKFIKEIGVPFARSLIKTTIAATPFIGMAAIDPKYLNNGFPKNVGLAFIGALPLIQTYLFVSKLKKVRSNPTQQAKTYFETLIKECQMNPAKIDIKYSPTFPRTGIVIYN